MKSIHELQSLYRDKKSTPEALLKELSQGIADNDGKIRSYVGKSNVSPKALLGPGPERVFGTRSGVLAGVPVAIKDNICVEGEEVTCGSKILKGFVAPYDATVIKKLKEAGAVIFGRMNMDEFAFGSSCETSCYGPTHNPHDFERVPGGSSGGSAAAVAGGVAVCALGSDTGGSIRQPAAFCGVVGLKPTYGRVSRYGLVAFASSLDQIGPITRDVRDAAILLKVIAGHDPKDSTSADVPVPDYEKSLGENIKGMKIGIPKEYFQKGLNPDVEKSVRDAVKKLESLGASMQEVSLPHTRFAVSVYYIVAPSEASSNLARFDGVRFGFRAASTGSLLEMYERSRGEGFGAEAKRRILLGTFSLSSGYYDAYYLRAMKVRTKIKNDFDEAFKKVDVIATPTAPSVAFKIGEKTTHPLEMYLSDIYTISVNLAGLPAISIPCGTAKPANGNTALPIGLQLIGKPFDEVSLLKMAYAYEQNSK